MYEDWARAAPSMRVGLAPSAHACASASITLHVAPAHPQVPLERQRAGDVGRRRVSNAAQKINNCHADTTPATRLRMPMPPKRVSALRRRQRQMASSWRTGYVVGLNVGSCPNQNCLSVCPAFRSSWRHVSHPGVKLSNSARHTHPPCRLDLGKPLHLIDIGVWRWADTHTHLLRSRLGETRVSKKNVTQAKNALAPGQD